MVGIERHNDAFRIIASLACIAILIMVTFYIPRTLASSDMDMIVNMAEEINEQENHYTFIPFQSQDYSGLIEIDTYSKPLIHLEEDIKVSPHKDIHTPPPDFLG